MENITLTMVYQKLQVLEEEIREINDDLHRIRPEFVEKLKKLEKGKFYRFRNLEEMERYMNKEKD